MARITELQYGERRRVIRETLDRQQLRLMTIALRREGFTFRQCQTITEIVINAINGAIEGYSEGLKRHPTATNKV